jgi:hypothetical protein
VSGAHHVEWLLSTHTGTNVAAAAAAVVQLVLCQCDEVGEVEHSGVLFWGVQRLPDDRPSRQRHPTSADSRDGTPCDSCANNRMGGLGNQAEHRQAVGSADILP